MNILTICIALAASSVVLAALVSATPQVPLGNVTLVGRSVEGLQQEFFGGIPYAQPPVGTLRFSPPILMQSLGGMSTFDASNFGVACLQPGLPPNETSEDCLTINVFRPAGLPSNATLPVMAWIFGGGFSTGSSSTFNGSALVNQAQSRGTPIIYVNFNYRLGPLGFPQGSEAESQGALNLGLKDQLTALEWIHNNIYAFGGDKDKVTLFGESVGSVSIGLLFLNSGLDGLVRGAILESGSAGTLATLPASHREGDWLAFASAVPECGPGVNATNTFGCLRQANSSEILAASEQATAQSGEGFPWTPLLDGEHGLIPDLPSKLWAKGQFSRLPCIAGSNKDEGTILTPQTINSTAEIYTLLSSTRVPSADLNASITALLNIYPDVPALGSPFDTGNNTFGLNSQYKRFAAIDGDLSFHSLRRTWMRTATCAGVDTWGYLFTDSSASINSTTLPPPPPAPGSLGVAHSSEIAYVYGFPPSDPNAQFLSQRMMDYWISFATSLDPNDGLGSQRPTWSKYASQNNVIMELDGACTELIPDTYREGQIAFINSDPIVWGR